MEDNRRKIAVEILKIEEPEIISTIYDKSYDLLKIELDSYHKIVDKGRSYLGMILILMGFILGFGNYFFKTFIDYNLLGFGLYSNMTSLMVSIIALLVSLVLYFRVSFIHKYYWFDFKELAFISSETGDRLRLYQYGQIVVIWDKINEFDLNNKKLVFTLKWGSYFALGGIMLLIISFTIAIYLIMLLKY